MVNEATIKELIRALSKKIRHMNESSRNEINRINDEINSLQEVVEILNDNPYEIANLNMESIISILNKYKGDDTSDEISRILSDIEIPMAVAEERLENNESITFNESESKIVEKFRDLIIKTCDFAKEDVRIKQELSERESADANKYRKLREKINPSTENREFLTNEEIDLIMRFINDWPTEKKMDVLLYTNVLINKIYQNEINRINIESEEIVLPSISEEDVEYVASPGEEIPVETINEILGDNGNGIDVSEISKRPHVIDAFQRRCKIEKLTELMNYIQSTPEYAFLKQPKTTEQCERLFLIFRYSNKDILEVLRKDSIKRNIDLKRMFEEIEGIYKRGRKDIGEDKTKKGENQNSLSTLGQFDKYMEISKILDDYSKKLNAKWGTNIDMQRRAFNNAISMFTKSTDDIKRNCDALEIYGLSDLMRYYEVKNSNIKTPALNPYTLAASDLIDIMDMAIESGDEVVTYIGKRPSIFIHNKDFYNLIREKDINHSQVFRNSGMLYSFVRDSDKGINEIKDSLYSSSATTIIDTMPLELKVSLKENNKITSTQTDSIIDKFDEYLVQNNRSPYMPAYNINGTLVSVHKFKRNWEVIKNYHDDSITEDQKILYAMVYPGAYSDSKIDNLKSFVDTHEYRGGIGSR